MEITFIFVLEALNALFCFDPFIDYNFIDENILESVWAAFSLL
jgi:hypothetical protein